MKYQVTVNEAHQFDVSKEDAAALDVVSIAGGWHALDGDVKYDVRLVEVDFSSKRFVLLVNNNRHEVALADEQDRLVTEMGFGETLSGQEQHAKAPMPGLVLTVHVEEGQEVSMGDPLLILEAMKMENVIAASSNGIIRNIAVEAGSAVEKGVVLVEIEPIS